MSLDINKKKCVFFAPLDTVLVQPARRYEPLIRFFALLNHHLVLSDTQLLDNRLFWDNPFYKNLALLLRAKGWDGLPFILVSQRNSNQSLLDILLEDMARVRASSPPPMKFSSLTRNQQNEMKRLCKQGSLTATSLYEKVGYPVGFAKKVAELVKKADYTEDITWPDEVKKPPNYFALFFDMIKCQSLPFQAGIHTEPGKQFLMQTIEKFSSFDKNTFSRTKVYNEIDFMKRGRSKSKDLVDVPIDDYMKVTQVIRAMADYSYLRNFADRSGFSFLLDNTHWLASSTVNEELQQVRPSAEQTDDFVERCLDLQEGSFYGFGSSGHATLSTLLRSCGFSTGASWNKIIMLRKNKPFWDRLQAIDNSTESKEYSALVREHLGICFSELLNNKTDFIKLFKEFFTDCVEYIYRETTSKQVDENTILTVLSFATTRFALGLTLEAKSKYRNWKQGFFIDQIKNSITEEFERRH